LFLALLVFHTLPKTPLSTIFSKMAPIRVGIICLGSSGTTIKGNWGVAAHLRSIQGLADEYEIVAVANSTVESAQGSVETHKLAKSTKAYGNPEDIAADPNVELVVVSVEVRKHYFLTMPALSHKKDIFVKWPLAANMAEAEELTKLAAVNGVKTMVGLQARG
jgi:predicted dehydrogenase